MMIEIKRCGRAQTEKGTLWDAENVLYLVWGASYLGIHKCQN